jgi:uncharacterized protein YgiM (DUF1202 family)
MKKSNRYVSLVLLMWALVVVLVVFAADTVVVKIQTTQLRKSPQFFSQAVVALKAGDRLTRVSEENGWIQVKTAAGIVGWIHSSAVEIPKFNLLAMDKDMKTQTKASEVALAGKGFNKQVEESYRAKHGEVSFIWVDKMIAIKVLPVQIEDFLKKGKLGEFRGAK